MTDAMSMVKLSSSVFRVFLMTINNNYGKKMTEASDPVCLLLALVLAQLCHICPECELKCL